MFFIINFTWKNIKNFKNCKSIDIIPKKLTFLEEESNNKLGQQYDGPSLEKLWTYSAPLTKERNVSCITWNKKNLVRLMYFIVFLKKF
jgi:hypothetical protein